jgi:hypothetical protein
MTLSSPPPTSPFQRLRRQIALYLLYFIEGDHSWGNVRWLGMMGVIVGCVIVGRLLEPIETVGWLEALNLRAATPPALYTVIELIASFFTRETLRHALPPLAGITIALYVGASYMRNLLELPTLGPAYKFLTATLFGTDYPRLLINEGLASVDDPLTNPMLKIGGPGWVDIRIGSAALFERLAGPSSVVGAGTHFIRRFETLRAAFDLREIERHKENIRVITKDGLPLILTEVRVRFRLKSREARHAANPYPVLVSAVRKAAYERKVTDAGLEPWPDTVAGAVVGTLTSWIGRSRMDELIPPPKENAPETDTSPSYRQALHDLFKQRGTRQRLADLGAEVVWVSVGHLRPDPDVDPDLRPDDDATGRDKIHEQFIETWKSRHQAAARQDLAEAQGYAHYLQDSARAQSQADLIISLTDGLREAREKGLDVADSILDRLIEQWAGPRYSLNSSSDLQRLRTSLMMEMLQSPNPPAALSLPQAEVTEIGDADEDDDIEEADDFDEEADEDDTL